MYNSTTPSSPPREEKPLVGNDELLEPCSEPASSATSAIGFHSNRAAANRAAGRVWCHRLTHCGYWRHSPLAFSFVEATSAIVKSQKRRKRYRSCINYGAWGKTTNIDWVLFHGHRYVNWMCNRYFLRLFSMRIRSLCLYRYWDSFSFAVDGFPSSLQSNRKL